MTTELEAAISRAEEADRAIDLIRSRMDYATEEHAKLMVVNADLEAQLSEANREIERLSIRNSRLEGRLAAADKDHAAKVREIWQRDDQIAQLKEQLRWCDPEEKPTDSNLIEIKMKWNHSDREVTFIGYYARKYEEEATAYNDDCEWLDYHEERDCFYYPEGWYECQHNWDEYSFISVSQGTVTGWRCIPELVESPPTSAEPDPFAEITPPTGEDDES